MSDAPRKPRGSGWAIVHGDFSTRSAETTSRVRGTPAILPNPFPPDNVDQLVVFLTTTAGAAGVAYKYLKLWFDHRNAQKIRIKKGDVEIEIQGGMDQKQIARSLAEFRKLAQIDDETASREIKVILPRGADRSLPTELPGAGERRDAAKPSRKRAAKKAGTK